MYIYIYTYVYVKKMHMYTYMHYVCVYFFLYLYMLHVLYVVCCINSVRTMCRTCTKKSQQEQTTTMTGGGWFIPPIEMVTTLGRMIIELITFVGNHPQLGGLWHRFSHTPQCFHVFDPTTKPRWFHQLRSSHS